ncbi:16158_t:CDS:2 [Funneliformis caledonium]|uniref:16158_t:CDS:1 n=1 Tax=Funneliformis caledonium TaxID=1117310 RepID=A0A9N8ZND7_9GLOM|nr:16158_t:CDS:2 [Funneliformis caledonium]
MPSFVTTQTELTVEQITHEATGNDKNQIFHYCDTEGAELLCKKYGLELVGEQKYCIS